MAGSKRIRISDDGRTTWTVIPGMQGELTSNAGTIDDTIFGAGYKSTQTGIISWSMKTNAFYKGFAGYVAKLVVLGTPTVMTGEPMSLVSGKTFQVTNNLRRIFDLASAATIYDNGVAVPVANILNIDYLFGRVTFVAGYTPTTPITVTSKYMTQTPIARANGFTLTQTVEAVVDTDFATAQSNSGHQTYIAGLKNISIALQGIFSTANDWRTQLIARNQLIVEINPDGSELSVGRGYFKYTAAGQSGNVGAQEAATATLDLAVPVSDILAYPFGWVHDPATTLNTSVIKALTAVQNGLKYDYEYTYNGVNGYQGSGIITDMSLSGGIEVMNDFTLNVQGSGQLTAIP